MPVVIYIIFRVYVSNKITLTLGRGRDSMTLMKQQEHQQQPSMRRGAARSTKNIALKSRQRRGMGYKMRCIPSTKTVCKNFNYKGATAQFCSVVSVSVCTALDWFEVQLIVKLSRESHRGATYSIGRCTWFGTFCDFWGFLGDFLGFFSMGVDGWFWNVGDVLDDVNVFGWWCMF